MKFAMLLDLVLWFSSIIIGLVICAGVAALGWCIIRGILEGVQQSDKGSEKDGD